MLANLLRQRLTAFAVFSLIAQCAWAADSATEQDYLQEFPVVLSASRLLQPLSDAPSAMTVIDRNMIVASGLRNLPDLFKLVPGMYVSYYKGSQAIVSYHGTLSQDSRGMQVMIDGRSVYMPPANTVDWALLPITLDDIDRIEVIRGPAAASYGENSMHGVINIITRDAGTLSGASVHLTRGNKGTSDLSGQFGKRGEKLDYRLTLASRADNGYDDRTATNYPAPSDPQLLNNSFDSNQARLMNFRASYHPNAVDEFDVQFGVTRDVQGVGFLDSGGGLNQPHDMISHENSQQLSWLHRTGDASELSLRYYHIQHNTDESYQALGSPLTHSVKSGRHDIEVQHTLHTSPGNRLVYGAGYRQDQVSANIYFPLLSPTSFPGLFNIEEYRVFANDEWRLGPKLIINAGGMLESDAMGYKSFSPRASLNYHLNPQHTVRVGASVAHRTPALAEQFGDVLVPGLNSPSPGLLSNKILSREFGYLGEFHKLGTSLDLRVFNDQISHVIYPLPPGSAYDWGNGMAGTYEGIEATIKHSFGAFASLTFNFAREQANSNFSALVPGKSDALSNSTPKNNISLLYSQRLANDFSFSLSYYQQSSLQPFDRAEFDFQGMQRRTDLRLAKSFKKFAGLTGDVAWVVQNLFNNNYTEYVANNVFNRRTYVTLNFH